MATLETFLMLGAKQTLRGLKRQDPDALPELERLCLVDIKLLEARPDIVQFKEDEDGQ